MSPAPARPSRTSRAPLIIAVVVAVVLAVFGVVALTSGGDDAGDQVATGGSTDGPAVTPPVEITGAPLPAVPQGGADPAVGKAFPVVKGSDVREGAPLAIEADGRAKVVIYLAHWCPHCQAEVPVITEWIAANGMPDDVDLYAVSTAVAPDRGNYPPAAWLAREGWPVPTLADDAEGSAFNAAGLTSFPSFVAVGADGKVNGRAAGELSTTQFEAVLDLARG